MEPGDILYDVRRYLSIKSSYSAAFSHDDSKVAYLTDITGIPQVWTISLDAEASPQQLTFDDERVAFISYASKSDTLAFSSDVGGDERFQLSLLLEGGERRVALTQDRRAIHSWGDWSPDESSVSFASNSRDARWFDIYVQDLGDLSRELVLQHDGHNFPVAWSPDGGAILFSRVRAPFDNDLCLLRLDDRSVVVLTPHEGEAVFQSPVFDPTGRKVYCVTDRGSDFPYLAELDLGDFAMRAVHAEEHECEELAASHDRGRLAFTLNEDGYSKLMVLEPGHGPAQEVPVPRSIVGGIRWSHRADRLAFTLSTSKTNADVWICSIAERSVRRLVRSSVCGIEEESFADAELVWFKSFDGRSIPSFFYRPTGTARSSPLVVYLHGGPESQYRPSFNPLVQLFLRLGLAVLAPNFRGSTGYGKKYTHLDDVYNRMDTVRDVEACVAQATESLPVDASRLSAWGGSYGGFMVLACLYSQPDLWSAGVDIVGISNFVTFLMNTGPWRRALRIPEYGDPEKDREFLERISPTSNAEKIKAPLFIIHGSNDPRVPLGEAEQIAATMRRLGREAQLMKFDDEGHGLVKLKNRIAGYTEAVRFLLAHLAKAE